MRTCCECSGWHTCQTRGWGRTTHIKVDVFFLLSGNRFIDLGKQNELHILENLYWFIENYLPILEIISRHGEILDKCVLTSLAPFTSELRLLWAPCWCFAMTSAFKYPQLTRTKFWVCSKVVCRQFVLACTPAGGIRVKCVPSAGTSGGKNCTP